MGRQAISNMLGKYPWSHWVLDDKAPPSQKKQMKAWVLPCLLICSETPDFSTLSWTFEHTGTHFLLLREPASSQGSTYRRIPNTAGKGYSTTLSAWVQVSAVEVDIEVPIIRSSGSTARPLQERRATGVKGYSTGNQAQLKSLTHLTGANPKERAGCLGGQLPFLQQIGLNS